MPTDRDDLIANLEAEVVRLIKEVERLKEGRFTHDELQSICHNLHESRPECTLEDFAKGCEEYQRKLFGRSYAEAINAFSASGEPLITGDSCAPTPTPTLPQRAMGGRGVAVVIRNTLGEILLLRRGSRCSSGCGTWSVPGGWIKPTEGPTEAAVRECMEEVGVSVERLIYLGHTLWNHVTAGDAIVVTATISYWYEAAKWHNIPENRDPDKATDMKWCALDKLPSPLYGHLCEALRLEILK